MCWRRLRAFLCISLAFWLLLPCSSWGDVVLSEAEATALETSLRNAKAELQRQEISIKELESSLSEARTLQEKQQTVIEKQQKELTRLSQSWKKQEREAQWGKVKNLLIGLGIGIAGGVVGGYYLATK